MYFNSLITKKLEKNAFNFPVAVVFADGVDRSSDYYAV